MGDIHDVVKPLNHRDMATGVMDTGSSTNMLKLLASSKTYSGSKERGWRKGSKAVSAFFKKAQW